jgi:hypothetical protein
VDGNPQRAEADALARSTCSLKSQIGNILPSATFPREEKGLAHQREVNAQVRDLGIHRWSYLPLTRTQRKPLTCGFATPWRSPAPCAPRPSTKRPGSLRDRPDEGDITDLITTYAEAPLPPTVPLPRLESQQCQAPPAHCRCPPDLTHSTS